MVPGFRKSARKMLWFIAKAPIATADGVIAIQCHGAGTIVNHSVLVDENEASPSLPTMPSPHSENRGGRAGEKNKQAKQYIRLTPKLSSNCKT